MGKQGNPTNDKKHVKTQADLVVVVFHFGK